jgi:hypothetical protein
MKDFLQDLVAHTHNLGFLPLVKVTADSKETSIESMAEDRSVVLSAKTHSPVDDLEGTFGMPNLNKLDLHLKNPEYKEGAGISVVTQQRNGEDVPTGLHFENATGDYENDYRFMNKDIINEKLKSLKFKGVVWDVECTPSVSNITRLKNQAQAHSEEKVFSVKTDGGNLVFSFGDASTHAGEFVFATGITGKLKQNRSFPVAQVEKILGLSGDITMKIADAGALQIVVDSGIAVYEYILPAQQK